MSTNLASYYQVGVSTPTTTVKADEGDQLIDLSETYVEEDEETKILVNGIESYFGLNKLSYEAALLTNPGLKNKLERRTSTMNAIIGGEGFFTTIKDSFVSIIEKIIEYIRKAFQWVVQKVKWLTGYSKSDRQLELCNKAADDIKNEIRTTLNRLGMSNAFDVDIDNIMAKLPKGLTKAESIRFFQINNRTLIESLQRTLQVADKVVRLISLVNRSSDDIVRFSANMSKRIISINEKLRKGQLKELEVREFQLDMMKGIENMGTDKIGPLLKDIVKDLYDIDTEYDGELNYTKVLLQNINNITRLNKTTIDNLNIGTVREGIKIINDKILSGSYSSADFTVNANFSTILSSNAATAEVTMIDNIAGNTNIPNIKNLYTRYISNLKQVADTCATITIVATHVKEAIVNTGVWVCKMETLYSAYAVADLDKAKNICIEYLKDGTLKPADFDQDGKIIGTVLVEGITSETIAEKASDIARICEDALGQDALGKKVKKLFSQLGIRVKI